MKKNFLYAVLAASLLLCGCEKEQLIDELSVTEQTEVSVVKSTETTAAVSAAEPSQTTFEGLAESKTETSKNTVNQQESTAAEEDSVPDEEIPYNEEHLLRILKYLQGDSFNDEYFSLIGFSQYDFWDKFTLDDYRYTYRGMDEHGNDIYDVTLTCSDSTCELFPNGESDWVFGCANASYFIPAEREEAFNASDALQYPDYTDKDGILYSAYQAAYDFTKFTNVYEADSEWFENFDVSKDSEYSAEQYVHRIYHAYNPYFVTYDYETGEEYDVTPEEFAAAVKKLYNINITAEQARSMTDETGFMVKSCGHGAGWLYESLAGFDETEDEIKVRIDYYGDELYLYRAVQSEYTFSKNEDGSITLQKVEKLFDLGYNIASGSV